MVEKAGSYELIAWNTLIGLQGEISGNILGFQGKLSPGVSFVFAVKSPDGSAVVVNASASKVSIVEGSPPSVTVMVRTERGESGAQWSNFWLFSEWINQATGYQLRVRDVDFDKFIKVIGK